MAARLRLNTALVLWATLLLLTGLHALPLPAPDTHGSKTAQPVASAPGLAKRGWDTSIRKLCIGCELPDLGLHEQQPVLISTNRGTTVPSSRPKLLNSASTSASDSDEQHLMQKFDLWLKRAPEETTTEHALRVAKWINARTEATDAYLNDGGNPLMVNRLALHTHKAYIASLDNKGEKVADGVEEPEARRFADVASTSAAGKSVA